MRLATLALALVAALFALAGPAAARWSEPVPITPHDVYTDFLSLAASKDGEIVSIGDSGRPFEGMVSYTSRDRAPFRARLISDSPTQSPEIGFDLNGTAIALSNLINDDNSMRVYVKPRGKPFGEPKLVDSRPGSPCGVVATSKDEVVAYWVGNDEETDSGPLRVAVRPPGGGDFGPAEDVSVGPDPAGCPFIAVDRNGYALIAWSQAGTLQYSIRPPGGAFGAPRVLEATAARGGYDFEANRAGQVIAVWRARRAPDRELRAARGTVAGGFGDSRNLGGKTSRWPFVAIDRTGQATAAWEATTAGNSSRRLRVAIARPGHGFGVRKTLYEGYFERGRVVADDHRTVTVAWLATGRSLRSARYTSGDGAFKREVVAQAGVRSISIGATHNGRTVLAWKTFVQDHSARVKTAVAAPRHPFGPMRTLAKTGRGAAFYTDPQVVVDGEGGAFVYWGIVAGSNDEKGWFDGGYLYP